jgi:outer membrane protein
MKKLVAVGAVLAILGTAWVASAEKSGKGNEAAATASSGSKIGYVDMNRALNEVNEGKAAKAKLEAEGKAKKQKLEIMQSELKKMKEDLDKQKLILSKEAMQEKESQFQQKFFELQKTSAEFEKQFAEQETNYIKPIGQKLQTVIQRIGQSEGYSMIVPREVALYSLPGTDITDKVIAAFNSQAK